MRNVILKPTNVFISDYIEIVFFTFPTWNKSLKYQCKIFLYFHNSVLLSFDWSTLQNSTWSCVFLLPFLPHKILFFSRIPSYYWRGQWQRPAGSSSALQKPILNDKNNLLSLILERAIREDLPHLTSLGPCWFMSDGKQILLCHVKPLWWSDNIKLKMFAAEQLKVMGWMLVCYFCSDIFWCFAMLIAWSLFALTLPISILITI